MAIYWKRDLWKDTNLTFAEAIEAGLVPDEYVGVTWEEARESGQLEAYDAGEILSRYRGEKKAKADGLLAEGTHVRYEGAVLADRERNGYHDSDFYAVVWDEEAGKTKSVTYNTTRFAGGGWCTVDATPEVRRKAAAYHFGLMKAAIREKDGRRAATVEVGKTVRVVKGRKVPIGTEGRVFWMGKRQYGPRTVTRLGIALDDEKDESGLYVNVEWVPDARNVEVIDDDEHRMSDSEVRRLAYRAAVGDAGLAYARMTRPAGYAVL